MGGRGHGCAGGRPCYLSAERGWMGRVGPPLCRSQVDGQPGDWPPKPHQCQRELGALTLDFVVVILKNHSAWSHGINRYLEQRFSVLGISGWIWGRRHKPPPPKLQNVCICSRTFFRRRVLTFVRFTKGCVTQVIFDCS